MKITPLVLDIIVAVILLIAAFISGKKGFYKSLMPLVVFVAAVLCAGFFSSMLEKPVTQFVYPTVEDKVIVSLTGDETPQELPEEPEAREDFLSETIKLLPKGLQPMAQRLQDSISSLFEDEDAPKGNTVGDYLTEQELAKFAQAGKLLAADSYAPQDVAVAAVYSTVLTMAENITGVVVKTVLWIVIFLVGLLVFKLLRRLLGFVFKLPVIRWLDKLGGFALGLALCWFALYAIGWLLTVFGVTALHDLADGTKLFSRFF